MSTPILLCFATGQNLANLIPALQLRPETVWILATPAMKSQAQVLKKLLERHQISSQIEAFADDDIATLQAESLRIAEKLDGQPMIFNATGGTKQMAFIMADNALQVLGPEVQGVIYADTQHQRIDWLRPAARGSETMDNLLTLEDILGAQGYRLGEVKSRQPEWISQVEERSQMTRELGEKVDKLGGLFGALNGLAQKALRDPTRPQYRQELDYAPSHQYAEILRQAHKYQLLEWDGDVVIEFSGEEAAHYFGGGWIEEYLFFKLRGNSPKDFVISAEIIAPDGKTTNEMDALVVHRNRLLAIECKTSRFGRDAGKDADIMYKLDSLAQRTGGLMHQGLLLSARTLDEISTARAREHHIEVLDGPLLKKLTDRIRHWMG